jgi:4-methoxybenzoate monooxygenase (O-demethylating)
VAVFEITDKIERRLNNTLRGLDTLPLRVTPV